MVYINLAVNTLSAVCSVSPSSRTNIQWSWKSSPSGYETKKSASIIWANEHKNRISQAETKRWTFNNNNHKKNYLTICEILQSFPQEFDPPVIFGDIFIVHCGNIKREALISKGKSRQIMVE